MIFVTVGTHPGQFDRLVRRMDELAPLLKEKVVIQRGFTRYKPKNAEYFDFAEDISRYFKEARLVISHAATSVIEFSVGYGKPLIVVPRQKQFNEHIDNHQVEFAEYFARKTGVLCVLDIRQITAELLQKYNRSARIDTAGLKQLQKSIVQIITQESSVKDRLEYVVQLLQPKKTDRVLNIGVSNIPEIEMAIENSVRECWTLDLDKKKLEGARKYLTKTRLVQGDIYAPNNFKKGYFDKIIILEVLEHLDDDGRAIRILREALKNGGQIIASVPNRDPLHVLNPVMYTQHKRHYSNRMFKELFTKNGFEIEHFNVVECWTLLANLYYHLIMKFIFNKETPFGRFKRKANRTYRQINRYGLDLIIKARKISARNA